MGSNPIRATDLKLTDPLTLPQIKRGHRAGSRLRPFFSLTPTSASAPRAFPPASRMPRASRVLRYGFAAGCASP